MSGVSYQHAPAVPSDAPQVLQATASVDGVPPLANSVAQIDRFRLLEGTVGVTIKNIQFSFGKQSLWLGPSAAGPLLLSDNAEPMTMLLIDTVSPYRLPLVSRLLGPVRSEFFIGQLSGTTGSSRQVFSGPPKLAALSPWDKSELQTTPNLEFGISFTAQFAGPGNPFTWHNFLRTFYSHRANTGDNPGKRLSAFDFSYRIPGLRKWLVLYSDSLVIDEYSPLVSNRPTINPGIYLPQLPKISKWIFE